MHASTGARMKNRVIVTPLLKRMIRSAQGDNYGKKFQRFVDDLLYWLAKEGRDFVSKYPRAKIRRPGKPYWMRGIGLVRDTKKGLKIYEPSQVLNARWAITKLGRSYMLYNTATYSGLVHFSKVQARVHKIHKWRTEQQMYRFLVGRTKRQIGTMKQIIGAL